MELWVGTGNWTFNYVIYFSLKFVIFIGGRGLAIRDRAFVDINAVDIDINTS